MISFLVARLGHVLAHTCIWPHEGRRCLSPPLRFPCSSHAHARSCARMRSRPRHRVTTSAGYLRIAASKDALPDMEIIILFVGIVIFTGMILQQGEPSESEVIARRRPTR